MTRLTFRHSLAAVAVMGVLAACSSSPGDQEAASTAPVAGGSASAGGGRAEGGYSFDVGTAGTIVLDVTDGQVAIAGVEPAEGWTERATEEDGDDGAEVELEGGEDEELSVDANVGDDGDLEVDVAWLMPLPDGPVTLQLGEMGSVTISVEGDDVRLASAEPGSGFVVEDEDGADSEVYFVNSSARMRTEFEAQVEGDRLRAWLDTTVGDGFAEPDDAEDEEDGDDSANGEAGESQDADGADASDEED